MDCRDVVDAFTLRLSGELSANRAAELTNHLASCESCRGGTAALAAAWERLGEDRDIVPSHDFRRATLALLEEETLRRRVRPFERRPPGRALAQIAAVLAAGFVGFSIGRDPRVVTPAGTGAAGAETRLPLLPMQEIDASKVRPDLSAKPRLANVAYLPADASGRISVAFDTTTRYTVVGKPDEKGVGDLLAYLVSGAGETEGARGRAIELVSEHFGGNAPPSPKVVSVLVDTLKSDRNPGVRKKAAEALAQLPPTPEIRDAFTAALKTETNPAIRIVAVEGLAKAALALRDPATIASLRERASDASENGYVRVKAATALKRMTP